jgi:sRNA-binding protein
MRLQGRNSGDQCAHSRRNADCGVQDVVDHQRRCRKQPSALAQVLAGHGVRSAAVRIRLDGLPVTEVDDHQQDHDRRAHGHDVLHAQQAERNQQREGGFRPVRSRAQCVQPEDRDSREGADLLGAFFAGSQRTPEQQIKKSCGYAHEPPSTIDLR